MTSMPYIGITIQSDHTTFMTTQLKLIIRHIRIATLSLLRRSLRLVSESLKATAYFTLVKPIGKLKYTAAVWSPWLDIDTYCRNTKS